MSEPAFKAAGTNNANRDNGSRTESGWSLLVDSPNPPSTLTSADTNTTRIAMVTSSNRGRKKPTMATATVTRHLPASATTTGPPTVTGGKKQKKKKRKVKYSDDWPVSSAESLPPLSDRLVKKLQERALHFPINEECTALTLSPSGRLLIACFTDGTLRLFDMTGTFPAKQQGQTSADNSLDSFFDMDASSVESSLSDAESTHPCSPSSNTKMLGSYSATKTKRGNARNQLVCSKQYQRFGAVASQIHAKGVHTSLLMDVDVAQDGQYCFAGVSRGSMELVAVHLGALEAYYDKYLADSKMKNPPAEVDLLDLITVYRRSDAKLRGFGACTRLRNATNENPKYLLFTGKGIKNIHIWKFEPPLDPKYDDDAAKWTQLYDTNTNGNSITYLQFRYDPSGLLQGISKSDSQKLRVWDISYEQHRGNAKNPFYEKRSIIQKFATQQEKQPLNARPKRPPFVDVAHSETTLGVCGGFSFCDGGSAMYNQISLVSLDVPNVQSPFNHTELALPGGLGDLARTSRRQQRGELKSITNVSGTVMDAGHVLMEVSDGSLVQYTSDNDQPRVEPVTIPGMDAMPPQEGLSRKFCLARVGAAGLVLGAVASYNSSNGRGTIWLRPLNNAVLSGAAPRPKGFWGFTPQLRLDPKKTLSIMQQKKQGSASDDSGSNSGIAVGTNKQDKEISITCGSPRLELDIPNWTNPPDSAIAGRTQPIVSTPGHGPSTNVQLFASSQASSKKTLTSAGGTKKKNLIGPRANTTKGASCSKTPLPVSKQVPASSANAPGKRDRRPSIDNFATVAAPSEHSAPVSTISSDNLTKSISRNKQSDTVPATPQLMTAEQHLAAARARSQTFTAASKGIQRVSPESRPGTSIKVASRKDVEDIHQSAELKKKAQNTHPSFKSPPAPRKRSNSHDEIHNIATALCEMGSAVKPDEASTSKRTFSDMKSTETTADLDDTTPRHKVPKKSTGPQIRRSQILRSDTFLSECSKQQERLEMILRNQIPKANVNESMGLISGQRGQNYENNDHEMARMKMAAQHRASHEQLVKRVFHAASSTIKEMKASSTISGVEEAEVIWQGSFQEYIEMLDSLLWRQKSESTVLSNQQTLENGHQATSLQCSFPFYNLFDDCIESIESIVKLVR